MCSTCTVRILTSATACTPILTDRKGKEWKLLEGSSPVLLFGYFPRLLLVVVLLFICTAVLPDMNNMATSLAEAKALKRDYIIGPLHFVTASGLKLLSIVPVNRYH
jgi:hypothetical protein